VTGAPRHPRRRGRGTDDVWRELAYFRDNRHRMEYAAAGHAISSGSVEATNRMPVTARTRRSRRGWGRAGSGSQPRWRLDTLGPDPPTTAGQWRGSRLLRDSRTEHQGTER